MSQQALYRKWRSRSFDELVGQPHVVQTLQNAVDSDRVAHAYLFSGPRGTGKTSTARILAKVVNCVADPDARPCNECHICRAINDGSLLDLIEIDAASNTQVDKVRDVIVEKVNFAPGQARRKVYIIDEVHMLSNSAFNALLKTIEEPPPHAMFILATTEIHKIPATILSRCQRLDFRRIGIEETAEHLRWVLEQEGIRAEPEVLTLVARQATGSMRDALSLLDQLLAHGGDHLTLAQARLALGLASTEAVEAVVDHLLAQQSAEALRLVSRLMDQGADPRQFLSDLLDHLRALLLTLAGGKQLLNLPEDSLTRLVRQARHVEPAALVEMIRLFTQAGADLKLGLQPHLPIELAIIESVLALQQRGAAPAPVPQGAVDDSMLAPEPEPARVPRVVMPSLPDDPLDEPMPDEFTDVVDPPHEEEPEGRADDPPILRLMEAPPLYPDPPSVADAPDDMIGVLAEERYLETDSRGNPLSWWAEQWERFMQFLTDQGDDGKRAALRLKFCEPHAVDGDELTLGFYYSLHLERVKHPTERAAIERALSEFVGAPMRILCKLVPKEERAQPVKTKYELAAEDPVVKAALRMGGRLTEVYLSEER